MAADVQTTQQKAGGEHGDRQAGGPAQGAPAHPIVGLIETMISAGRHSTAELAAVVAANPFALSEILAALHRLIGNAAVQAVLAVVSGQTSAPLADESEAPGTQLGAVRVTASRLRVRRGPSTKEDNVIGALAKHAVVTAVAREGAWLQIEYEGQTAYIHGDFVEPVDAPKGKPAPRPSAAGEDAETGPEAAAPVPAGPAAPVAPPAPKPDDAPAPVAPTPVAAHEAPVPVPAPVQAKPPAPAPSPTPAPSPAADDKKPTEGEAPAVDTPKVPTSVKKDFFEKVYTAGSKKYGFQQVQVFVSPGGITSTPDVFLHFHGHRANYKLAGGPKDNSPKHNAGLSGIDVVEEAMRKAKDKNTVSILPQGVIAEDDKDDNRTDDGGYMAALQQGLPTFMSQVLSQLGADLQMPDLKPGAIGISGHSAGGYSGVHDAMRLAGELQDTITDVTLEDTAYSTKHFKDTLIWMYQGKPGKTIRIIGTNHQTDSAKARSAWAAFDIENLEASAPKAGFTVESVGKKGEVRDKNLTVEQHTRIMKGSEVQADVLILRFVKTGKAGADHQPLMESVIDDAIFSIGDGAASNDTFGMRQKGDPLAGDTHDLDHDDDHDDDAPAAPPPPPPAPAPVEQKADDHHGPADAGGEVEAPKKAKEVVKEKVEEKKKKAEEPKKKKKEKPAAKKKSSTAVDEYGNLTERVDDRSKQEAGARTFTNSFTAITNATLYNRKGKKLKEKLPSGTKVKVGEMVQARVQIITADYTAADDVWIDFSSLGGKGDAGVGLGNEHSDPEDKARADKIRAGLPAQAKPGTSKHSWKFSGKFKPSLDGVALDSSLMSKVNALMEWAIANDMVVGDISIGSGMRPPKSAHYMCVRYELSQMGRFGEKHVSMANLKALPGGRDEDGNKWYEEGWTMEQVIEYAKKKLKDEGASGKPAAAGYNFGDSRRLPLALNGSPGVSRHCSGHAVDVDIPWRSPKDGVSADVWAWEHIYHQFGLTRPLHRDRASAADSESWHIEETGKDLAVEGEDHDG